MSPTVAPRASATLRPRRGSRCRASVHASWRRTLPVYAPDTKAETGRACHAGAVGYERVGSPGPGAGECTVGASHAVVGAGLTLDVGLASGFCWAMSTGLTAGANGVTWPTYMVPDRWRRPTRPGTMLSLSSNFGSVGSGRPTTHRL